jgi:hypothetical protein
MGEKWNGEGVPNGVRGSVHHQPADNLRWRIRGAGRYDLCRRDGWAEDLPPCYFTGVFEKHNGKWLVAQAHFALPAAQAEDESVPT